MSFPAYPTYKESGVDWLGAIPSDWVVAGLKHRFNIVGGSTPKSDVPGHWDGSLPWITPADLSKLQSRFITQTIRSITEAGLMSCGTTLVPAGSVVLSTRAPIGSLAITAVEACTNQGCKALVPLKGADSTFAFYALSVATEQLNVRGKGTTFLELSSDELGAFSLTFPPLSEQRSIVAFLDRETVKIDALVEEQRRLIALLKEKRQAVISHAVTKGLNPDAPMKDSGVEWLGEVPAHWEVRRIKTTLRGIKQGWSPQCDADPVDSFDFWGVLKVGCVNGGQFNPAENKALPLELEPLPELAVRAGDVLVSRANTRDLVGSAALVESDYERLLLSDKLYCLDVDRDQIDPGFLALYLQSDVARGQIEVAATGASSSMLNIGQAIIREMPIAKPSGEEQREILAYIKQRRAAFSSLVSEANDAIAILKERRAALISAAVTGKIDVRGSAKVLPFPVNRARARGLVAAEIIERSAHQATFGRVKLQKIAYLAEAYAGVVELEGTYLREAAGPLDREMIREMEREAGALAGVRVEQPDGAGSAVTYRPGDRRGAYRQDLAALLGDRAAKFDKLIEDIGTIDTKGAEAVATLYAVWNDAMIDGETPADMEIKLAVLSEWHPEKAEKFTINELQIWLDWMRRHGLVPTGVGPKTSTGRLFA